MSKVGKGCPIAVIGGVEVTNFQELCDCLMAALAAGLEMSHTEAGCALDANGSIIGKAFITKQINEDGTGETNVISALLFDDGTGSPGIVTPYAGPIGACAQGQMQVIALEELCVLVDGVPAAATPISIIDPILGAVINTIYLDEMGALIEGVVEVNPDPCSCGCVNCTEAPSENVYQLEAFMQTEDTKYNLDDPTFTNAYGNVSAPWTATDLANSLNTEAANAVPPMIPSGIDYSTTIWAGDDTANNVYVVSGPAPTTLDLVSIGISIPVS